MMLLYNKLRQTNFLITKKYLRLKNFQYANKFISIPLKLRYSTHNHPNQLITEKKEPSLKHIPLLFEIKILYLLSNKTPSASYDNLSEIINIISAEENVINQVLLNNIFNYILKEYEKINESILVLKLNKILNNVLTKYFKSTMDLPIVMSYTNPLLNENTTLKIIQLFNKVPVDKKYQKEFDEILYTTVPLIYRFYYENYTTIKDYKYGNDLNKDEITSFIKLPLLSDTTMLRSISKDNHRLANGVDIIKLNTLNNNYENKGAGNSYYESLKFGVFKTGIKNHFTRVNYLPCELKKDDFDITLTFTDKYHVLKQFSNHKLFLNMQLYQIEMIIKKLYLHFNGNVDLVDEKTCLAVMNQFFCHMDSFINMDPHQYQSENKYSNTLLNSIKVSDFPHLYHFINYNKAFIKNLVDKQLFYKVVKRKLVDRKIKYYNFKDIDDANMSAILNNKIIDSVKDKEKYMPYRRISRKKRGLKKKDLLKTIHYYCINYYPKYLLRIYKRDEEIAVKLFSKFELRYTERRRRMHNKKLPFFKLKKIEKQKPLDPIQKERFRFNKIFNPHNTRTEILDEEIFIPRNITILKLYLKFIYMNLENKLMFDINSNQDLHYLKEKVFLLQNFQDDEIFSVENSTKETALMEDAEEIDESTKNKLMVKKLLFQFCGE